MSEFRAALDLDHRYCSLCAERAKPGRGKPVLIMRIGFFACFHTISLETQSFQPHATNTTVPKNDNLIPKIPSLLPHQCQTHTTLPKNDASCACAIVRLQTPHYLRMTTSYYKTACLLCYSPNRPLTSL